MGIYLVYIELIWVNMGILWIYMGKYGYIWVYMGIFGYTWV